MSTGAIGGYAALSGSVAPTGLSAAKLWKFAEPTFPCQEQCSYRHLRFAPTLFEKTAAEVLPLA